VNIEEIAEWLIDLIAQGAKVTRFEDTIIIDLDDKEDA